MKFEHYAKFRNLWFKIAFMPAVWWWKAFMMWVKFSKWYMSFIGNCFLFPVTGDWLTNRQWGLLWSGACQVVLQEFGVEPPPELEGNLWKTSGPKDENIDEWYARQVAVAAKVNAAKEELKKHDEK